MRRLIIVILFIAIMAGCSKETTQSPIEIDGAVSFTTANAITRSTVDKSEWADGDRIGIYSKNSDGTIKDCNVEYVATINTDDDNSVSFIAADSDNQIYYTSNTDKLSFVAYYPYDEELEEDNLANGVIPIDLALLQNDLLVSKIVTQAQTSGSVTFEFSHALAMFEIIVTPSTATASLFELRAFVTGSYTDGSYNLLTPELTIETTKDQVEMSVTIADNSQYATVRALMMPWDYTTNTETINVFFEIDGKAFYKTLSPDWSTAGTIYKYTSTAGNSYNDIAPWSEESEVGASSSMVDIQYVAATSDEESGVYKIYTAKGLKAFSDLVNGSANTGGATTYGDGFAAFNNGTNNLSINGELMNDIDLSTECSSLSGVSWVPIGNWNYQYSGTFDGCGYEVSGLYINTSSANYKGLFGYLDSGIIRNIGVRGSVTGASCVGGVVAYAASSTVANCYNHATVTGSANVGGVAGQANSVTTCYNAGVVRSASEITTMGNVAGTCSSMSYCYYDSSIIPTNDGTYYYPTTAVGDTSSVKEDNTFTNVTGLSTENMQGTNTLLTNLTTGVDEDSTLKSWVGVEGDYPKLSQD